MNSKIKSYNLVLILIIMFLIFILTDSYIFLMVLQSLFFNVFLLSFLLLSKDKNLTKKNKLNMSFKNFIHTYIFQETCLNLVVLMSCLIFKLSFGVSLLCLFKQGLFPFSIYLIIFMGYQIEMPMFSYMLIYFLLMGKIWALLLYGKVPFCLEFYLFSCFLTMLFILVNLKGKFNHFLGMGVTFNSMPLGLMVQFLDFFFLLVYYFLFMGMFFKLLKFSSKNSYKFMSKDEVYMKHLTLTGVNNLCLTFFTVGKIIFLMYLGIFSYWISMVYMVESMMLLLMSLIFIPKKEEFEEMGFNILIFFFNILVLTLYMELPCQFFLK